MAEVQRIQYIRSVIGGMKGLAGALFPIPVQLCQFHQMLTVRHYLTQEPDLEASIELLNLANSITRMGKDSFIKALNRWYGKYQDVLNERVHDKRIKRKTPGLLDILSDENALKNFY